MRLKYYHSFVNIYRIFKLYFLAPKEEYVVEIRIFCDAHELNKIQAKLNELVNGA